MTFLLPMLLLAADAQPAYAHPELLIEAADLQKVLPSNDYCILDVRDKSKFAAGHVPGAIWVDHDLWSRKFAATQDEQVWIKLLKGVDYRPGCRVVIYDDKQAKNAARIWWIMRYWSLPNVQLLNGGWPAWQAANGKTSKNAFSLSSEPKPFTLKARADWLATKQDVLAAMKDKQTQIIDTRSRGEFCGTTKVEKRSGAIPGAIHLEWVEVIDAKTSRFKPPHVLAELLQKDINARKPCITHCQSGGRAAVLAFALELACGTKVRNYYRGWSEWGASEDTPIVVPVSK